MEMYCRRNPDGTVTTTLWFKCETVVYKSNVNALYALPNCPLPSARPKDPYFATEKECEPGTLSKGDRFWPSPKDAPWWYPVPNASPGIAWPDPAETPAPPDYFSKWPKCHVCSEKAGKYVAVQRYTPEKPDENGMIRVKVECHGKTWTHSVETYKVAYRDEPYAFFAPGYDE